MDGELSVDSYRIFNIVAKTGNITKASKELFISQPAVSKAITKLEQALSVTLFTRNSRGVKLTEEGRLLYEYTNNAFSKLIEGENVIRKISSLGIGHIRIGTSTTLCKYILLPYLKEFITLYPHIHLTIQCQSTFHTLSLLSEGKVDIGFVAKPYKLSDREYIPIDEIEDIFVATPSYLNNLKYREGINTDNPKDIEFEKIITSGNLMLLDEENITRQYLENYFNTLNIKTGQILEVSSMDLLIEFAKIGMGIACVIKSFVEEELNTGLLVRLPVSYTLEKREIGFVYTSKYPHSESFNKFMEFCNVYNNDLKNTP